jgi:hypothetical protein
MPASGDGGEPRADRSRQVIELLSAVLMAVATIATAWSAYQASEWNSRTGHHNTQATTAIVMVGKLSNLALQRASVHVNLFVQWLGAVKSGNTKMADFVLHRFPEPLKAATLAWQATSPFTNPDAPASPFDMPEYVLAEQRDADRWNADAETAFAEADRANVIASRYMMFSIIFASVLFFAGISGKFGWLAVDRMVLLLGAATLVAGLVVMFWAPKA